MMNYIILLECSLEKPEGFWKIVTPEIPGLRLRSDNFSTKVSYEILKYAGGTLTTKEICMNKKRFLVATLVCMLAFSLIPSYEASALDEDGFFVSTGERDTWMLGVLKDYPYYIVGTGGQLESNLRVLAELLPTPAYRKDMVWIPKEYPNEKPPSMDLYFVFADSPRGSGACIFLFAKDKNALDTVFAPRMANLGCSVFGPFFSGSTDTTRRAALKRIIDGTTSYRATRNEKNPWS